MDYIKTWKEVMLRPSDFETVLKFQVNINAPASLSGGPSHKEVEGKK
jgi:hypothetical protein